MEEMKIKEWYLKTYADSEGNDLKEDITFYDLFKALDNYEDIYEFLGVNDSIIRGRIFKELAIIMGVDYNYIYNQWLLCK